MEAQQKDIRVLGKGLYGQGRGTCGLDLLRGEESMRTRASRLPHRVPHTVPHLGVDGFGHLGRVLVHQSPDSGQVSLICAIEKRLYRSYRDGERGPQTLGERDA